MLDVVVRPEGVPAPTSDTPSRVRVGRGGAAANLAVALRAVATTTTEVVFAGTVGDDGAGALVIDEIRRTGVVTHVRVRPGSTGAVVSMVDADGARAMFTQRGVNSQLRSEDVTGLFDESLAHLHVSGYTVLDDATRPLVTSLFEAARAAGATTSVDVCSLGPLLSVGVGDFVAVARHADTLFANEEEALAVAGASDALVALDHLARTWREVVITRGARGALARADAQTFQAAARALDVVDTTGAGDAATGVYLGHRLNGASVEVALEAAMSAAARVVGGLGSAG